ncbi:hypothetical protein AOQ72_33825 [Bradyrhizobium yuanmingense]|uniref:Uncharacterized protein n=1 Tax=Bradyrhizobium yuanmingense TaxID=108015 RepID=A0A0R3BZ68_9BRAD|nr:hypothetical protein [Bradyrhizobium yuanmingense]KRP90761.1 hypothetical protein AOQ72_33825 [Bradyrhizobium yuanmingense]
MMIAMVTSMHYRRRHCEELLRRSNPESLNRAVWIASLPRLDESEPELTRLASEITGPRGKHAWLLFQHAQLS